MTLTLSVPKTPPELRPRIVVFGVGGAGCNAVNNMLNSDLEGVICAVANTDSQSLAQSRSDRQVQLGLNITQGLGAGSRPEIGRAAAEEEIDQIAEHLNGSHMVFITAGMGGGTGTGAAPVIARAARENGILTVGVVTKPFHFEGAQRMRLAEAGLQELQDVVDTLIVIPNQNLFRVANEKTTFADAFRMADEVLHSGVRGITDLMVMPGLINLDFADIRSVMSEMGKAMMGAGEAEGENRSIAAAESAISNPLLDDVSMKGARGLLINISGGPDLTLYEVDEAANRVRDEVDPSANIIFGSTFDPVLEGRIRVSVFATGIDSPMAMTHRPTEIRVFKPATNGIGHDPQPDRVAAPAIEPAAEPAEPAPIAASVADMPEAATDPEPDAPVAAAPEMPAPAHINGAGSQAEMFARSASGDISGPAEAEKPVHWQAPVETGEPAGIEAAVPAEAAPDAAPVPSEPAPRPTELAQTVDRMLSPGPTDPAGTPPELPASLLRPGGRAVAESVPAGPEDGGRRDSIFGFLRSRRRDAEKPGGASADAGGRNAPDRKPNGDARAEATVRLITDSDRSRRETAGPAAPDRTPPAEPGRTADRSSEEDLLEIPAFLRRQAN